jgi:hypothetical protein
MMALGCASTLVGQDSSSQKQHSLSFHLEMALQAESYSNGDSTYFIAKARRAESGFTIREGKILVEGIYEQYLEYNLEVGSASCLSGGFIVMEAGILLKPLPHWKVGVTKGHVLRGFEMNQECVQLLTAEKPLFAMKYSPCHPLGAKVEFERDFGEHSGLLAQLVVAEGTGGTLDDEHDINIGVHYRTPFPGFTLASSYTFWKWNAPFVRKDSILAPGGARDDYTIVWIEDKAVYDGYRAIVGFDYDASNLQLRGEAFIGKAYKDLLDIPYYAEIWADSSNATKIAKAPFEELEMNAFLVQAGYTLPLNNGRFSYLQPYIQYQWWDQAANLDGDYQSAFLTIGFNVGIGPGDARFRIDYQTCLSFAGDGGLPGYGEDQHADRLLARLQVGI